MTDGQTSIPASRPIETIVVEFDDLITAMQYNAENRNQNEYKNLRVQYKNIDNEGCVKADLFHDDRSRYPADISLTPIHLPTERVHWRRRRLGRSVGSEIPD